MEVENYKFKNQISNRLKVFNKKSKDKKEKENQIKLKITDLFKKQPGKYRKKDRTI